MPAETAGAGCSLVRWGDGAFLAFGGDRRHTHGLRPVADLRPLRRMGKLLRLELGTKGPVVCWISSSDSNAERSFIPTSNVLKLDTKIGFDAAENGPLKMGSAAAV